MTRTKDYQRGYSSGYQAGRKRATVPAEPVEDIDLSEQLPDLPLSGDPVQIIAGNPAEMESAQNRLYEWCAGKISQEKEALVEAEENLWLAEEGGWRADPWKRVVSMAKKRVQFFGKMKAAIGAGYYIVPPMPVQLFAIRTDRHSPDQQRNTNRWDEKEQPSRALPVGKGRYISNMPEVWQRYIPLMDNEGKDKSFTEYYAYKFRDVDFPFRAVKPRVLELTSRAMGLKIFDQIGVLPAFQTGGDPVVVGQIKHPKPSKPPLTFFIAWWLDTGDL